MPLPCFLNAAGTKPQPQERAHRECPRGTEAAGHPQLAHTQEANWPQTFLSGKNTIHKNNTGFGEARNEQNSSCSPGGDTDRSPAGGGKWPTSIADSRESTQPTPERSAGGHQIPPPGAYQHGAVPQEVEVAVLAEEVTLGVRGVELLAAHDEVVGEITPWGGRTDGQTERGGHRGELLPAAGSGGLRPQGGFVPKATSPKAFRFWAREGAGVKERPF